MKCTTRFLRAPLIIVVILTAVVACNSPQTGGECPEYPEYATPADALNDAQYVVAASIGQQVETSSVHGKSANAYTVSTDGLPVFKGEDIGFKDLRVISTPQCGSGDAYPNGDPLEDTQGTIILFLTRDTTDENWRTLTPEQGSVALTDDVLPQEWPEVR